MTSERGHQDHGAAIGGAMHVRIINHNVRWPHPANHYDIRVCPECECLVPGPKTSQRAHQRKHDRDAALIAELAKRCGMTEEQIEGDWSWGAEITGVEGEIEAAE